MNKHSSIQTSLLVLILVTVVVGGAVALWSIGQVTRPLAAAERTVIRQVEQMINPTPTVRPDPVTIIKEIRRLSRLETAAYTMEKIVTAESRQGPLSFLVGDRLILVAHGEVIAGVNLDRLDERSVTLHDDGSITVALPQAEVFFTTLNSDQSYVFDRDTGVIGLQRDLETEARRVAEQTIQEAALEDGILDVAQENAESTVRQLVLKLGFEDVRITD